MVRRVILLACAGILVFSMSACGKSQEAAKHQIEGSHVVSAESSVSAQEPEELSEAAILDGCSVYGIYFRIFVPLSKNTILTVLSMSFIGVWNDYLFSLLFINSTSLKTVSLGMQDFISETGYRVWGSTFATICITTVPTLIIYFALNKKVSGGMTLGATKG